MGLTQMKSLPRVNISLTMVACTKAVSKFVKNLVCLRIEHINYINNYIIFVFFLSGLDMLFNSLKICHGNSNSSLEFRA